MKSQRLIYFAITGLLSLLMVFAAGMYVINHQEVSEVFVRLGYPTYVIYPLATAKILGLIAIWSNYSKSLKEWAYAGFFFDFLLALSGHVNAADGEWLLSSVALALLAVSYVLNRKVYG